MKLGGGGGGAAFFGVLVQLWDNFLSRLLPKFLVIHVPALNSLAEFCFVYDFVSIEH